MISAEYNNHNELQRSRTSTRKTEQWIALALCALVLVAGILEQFVHNRPAYAGDFAPAWLVFAAAGISAAAIIQLIGNDQRPRMQQLLCWTGIFLLVWAANGLPLDLLRLTPLIPLEVDWPGLITKTSALAAAIVLSHIALTRPETSTAQPAKWYGYAAFLLALPYPVLRTWWALGGTPGLLEPGAAGIGFIPWLASIPWLLAAVLSLLLISTRIKMPRGLMLSAGWFATAVVAMIGPAACWSLVSKLVAGEDLSLEVGIAAWVPCLFYSSWLLWAIAAGVATRSYQLRSDLVQSSGVRN